jgi:hypothetical protein
MQLNRDSRSKTLFTPGSFLIPRRSAACVFVMWSFKVPGAWVDEEASQISGPPSPVPFVAKASLPTLQTIVAPAAELTSSPESENNTSPEEDQRLPLPTRPADSQPTLPPSDAVHDRTETRPPLRALSKADWLCNSCEEEGPSRFYCNICQYTYCEKCWNIQLPHRKLPKPNQLPHERTDLELELRIRRSLRPNRDLEENVRLHRNDESATWFGIAPNHDRNFESDLGDSGRLEELISRYPAAARSQLYPSLVSFIGQTGRRVPKLAKSGRYTHCQLGAGKSGLVNLLISVCEILAPSFECTWLIAL